MAAAIARSLPGLLRPLAATLCCRTPKTCRFSSVLCGSATPATPTVRAPVLAAVGPTPRFNLLLRGLTYYSVKKGKRKSVKSVTERFMRLHCGLWIRRKAGYKKKLWRKLPARRKRLREHVFCNKTQCKLLDKMTTSFWKRRNWFVNDPYLKYHNRVNLKV